MTLNTLTSGQAAQIVVIDPAYLPAKPTGMRAQRFYLMGLGISLVLGIGLCVLFTLLDDRIRDRRDAERLQIAPVLAEVAQTPAVLASKAKRRRPARAGRAGSRTAATRTAVPREGAARAPWPDRRWRR